MSRLRSVSTNCSGPMISAFRSCPTLESRPASLQGRVPYPHEAQAFLTPGLATPAKPRAAARRISSGPLSSPPQTRGHSRGVPTFRESASHGHVAGSICIHGRLQQIINFWLRIVFGPLIEPFIGRFHFFGIVQTQEKFPNAELVPL